MLNPTYHLLDPHRAWPPGGRTAAQDELGAPARRIRNLNRLGPIGHEGPPSLLDLSSSALKVAA